MTRARALLTELSWAAKSLGALRNEVVFVGGATVPCYVDDPAAPDVRPTDDVDVVIKVLSRAEYHHFEERLRAAGFANDQSDGSPICRWTTKSGHVFDVMPTDTSILGFSNPWYTPGFDGAVSFQLPDGTTIRVFSLVHFVLSKWEAFRDRGSEDPSISHDLEDLVAVLDGRKHVTRELRAAGEKERAALRSMSVDIVGSTSL